ncbi:hypothetical protein TeGR_g7638, partial [Tetraparma gracilis]
PPPPPSSPCVTSNALTTLASLHLSSISCSLSATLESRSHGLSLLSSAYATSLAAGQLPAAAAVAKRLAGIYERGHHSIPQDFGLSVEWYLRAADECGDVEAMVEYGTCAEMGYGLPAPDEALAFRWFEAAAEGSFGGGGADGEACCSVGEYYEKGRGGVPMNHVKAVEWYKRGVDGDGDEDCEEGLERLAEIAAILRL